MTDAHPRGAIDAPAYGEVISPGELRIEGWVFAGDGPLEDALVLVGDLPPVRPRLGLHRPDVGAAFAGIASHAEASGFSCDVDVRSSKAGPLRIELLARSASSGWRPAATIEVTVASADLAPGTRPRAAFTIVQNEPVMLPLWLDYYGRYFAPDDLYVLDHGGELAADGDISSRATLVPVHRELSFDHRWLRGTVERFQAFLLQSYEVVAFAEADEFIVADPLRYRGLDHYIDALEGQAARCTGFNVVHQEDEPPLRFDRPPLLTQRRYWHASLQYCKRLISRIPLAWSEGFHVEYVARDEPPDPALLLVHLHRIDYGACRERHRSAASRTWNPGDLQRGASEHYRSSEEEFERWFRAGPDLESPRELIPQHIQTVL